MTFTFRTLLDRVEKGERRDLSLEGDLLRVLLGDDLRQWPKRYLGLGEAITSSIDASRALVQVAIPGALVASGSMEDGPFCSMVVPREDGTYIGGGMQAFATSEPRAVLACLLRAKIAQEERT